MINIIGLILLIIFKDSMNQILWWILMAIDILSFVVGIFAMIVKAWEIEKLKREEREYINSLVDTYLR